MKRYSPVDDAVLSEINITPFTDVLLVLLIIFMILAALVVPPGFEKQLESHGPSTTVADRSHPLVVTIRKDGLIFVDAQRTDEANIYSALASAVRRNPKRPLQLVEDAKAPYGLAIRVLDAAKAAGTTNVSFVSE